MSKSWILVRKSDGKPLLEIFSEATLNLVTDDYKTILKGKDDATTILRR